MSARADARLAEPERAGEQTPLLKKDAPKSAPLPESGSTGHHEEPERDLEAIREATESSPLLAGGASPESGKELAVLDEDSLLTGKGHAPFLDVTRIVCIACVAIDHGYRPFGQWNALFAQDWVLQYLYLVCGVCYGMSRKTLRDWEARLALYFVSGSLLNWMAWIIAGKEWEHNMFNVIFHMWFIVGLMAYGLLLCPLRPYLEQMRERARNQAISGEEERPLPTSLAMTAFCLAVLVLIFKGGLQPVLNRFLAPMVPKLTHIAGEGAAFWGMPNSDNGSEEFVDQLTNYVLLTASNVFLVLIGPKIMRASFTAWLVFLNTYGHRLCVYRGATERPFHGLDLMILALTVYYLGLWKRRTIGRYFARYWFVVIFVCGLVWKTGVFGRFDEKPPTDWSMRLRVNFVEAVFVISWLVCGERMAAAEIFSEDKLEFLNEWALLVFLVHKAVHIVFPDPYNWMILVALAPLCWLHHYLRSRPGSSSGGTPPALEQK